MQLQVEGVGQKTNLVELEKALMTAKNLVCGDPLVRSLLLCIRKHHGRLEENRVVDQFHLWDFL